MEQEFSEFSEFKEYDKSLEHELKSVWRFLYLTCALLALWLHYSNTRGCRFEQYHAQSNRNSMSTWYFQTFGKYDPYPFSSLLVTYQNIQSLSVTLLSYLSYLELGVGLFLNLLERTDIFYLYYLTFPLEWTIQQSPTPYPIGSGCSSDIRTGDWLTISSPPPWPSRLA